MKKIIICFFLFCTATISEAQSAKASVYKGDGGINVSTTITRDNNNNKYVSGYVQTTSGNYVVATIKYFPFNSNPGWISRFGGNSNFYPASIAYNFNTSSLYVTGTTDSGGNGMNVFLISYDQNTGNVLWSKFYNGSGNGNDAGKKVIYYNGFIYIAGYSCESDSLSKEYLLLKYDTNGNLIFKKNYKVVSNSNDEINDLAINTQTDNLYVTGKSLNSNGNFDYATLKYDLNGNQIWAKRFASTSNANDVAVSLIPSPSPSTGVIVTGYADSSVDYTTIKYDSAGIVSWTKIYNGTANDEDYPVVVKSDINGNIIVTGSSKGVNSNYDYLTIKYNSDGLEQWVNRYDGDANNLDSVAGMEIDNFNCIFVTGKSKTAISDYDVVSILYNTAGWYHWIRSYNYAPYNGDDIPYALVKDNGWNTFTITGRTDSSSTRSAFLTFAYGGVIDGINYISNQIPDDFNLHQNYPNPFNPSTNIRFEIPNSGNIKLYVYNTLGQKVFELNKKGITPGIYETTFDAKNLPSGIYFYRLDFSSDTKTFSRIKKMLLIK